MASYFFRVFNYCSLFGDKMTNAEKNELRNLAKNGLSFEAIRRIINCSDATIKQYLKIFKRNKGIH